MNFERAGWLSLYKRVLQSFVRNLIAAHKVDKISENGHGRTPAPPASSCDEAFKGVSKKKGFLKRIWQQVAGNLFFAIDGPNCYC